jgi:signal transduction histidine kinase
LARYAVTGLLAVCILLSGGLGLTALVSFRAARHAAEDVLYSRATEVAGSFVATARMTGSMRSEQRLQTLAREMATDGVTIAVVELDGRIVVEAGADSPSRGAQVRMSAEDMRSMAQQGQAHRLVGTALEYWRPMRGGGREGQRWPWWGAKKGRPWWSQQPTTPDETRDVRPGREPLPSWVPAPWRTGGGLGLRLLRVTVPRSAAGSLTGPARLTMTLSAVASALLLLLGVLLHRAARRAQRSAVELQRRRALAALGEMAAVLAHEIRTPLGSIKGNAQLIGEERAGDERVQSIVEESGRLERLVNGLLDYARPPAPRRVACDPDALMERAVQIVAPKAVAASVNLVTDPAHCGSCLRADPDQVLQLLVNLLQNGVEACAIAGAHGNTVAVQVRRGGGSVTYTVQDAGPGLQGAEPEQIFRPFFSTKHQGTGLGLSVARQIVEQHGGELDLRDRREGGVVATARLPEEVA